MSFGKIKKIISEFQLKIVSYDLNRPWGGFYVIDESQAQEFSNIFFDSLDVSKLKISGKLSPKLLVIKPNKRLSWQYHLRRAEIWRVIEGEIGVKRSFTDEENETFIHKKGDFIKLEKGERHRLIGLDKIGIVAEIWQHTDEEKPSDENDIIRIQDDFNRT